jgi:hypothetical protein
MFFSRACVFLERVCIRLRILALRTLIAVKPFGSKLGVRGRAAVDRLAKVVGAHRA